MQQATTSTMNQTNQPDNSGVNNNNGAQPSSALPREIENNLRMAFGEAPLPDENFGQEATTASQGEITPATPATPEAAIAPSTSPETNTPVNTPATAQPAAAPSDDDVFDETDYLNKTYGFESAEKLKEALEELKNLKATPALKQLDEQSKLIYDYLAEGKTDEVLGLLSGMKSVRGLEGKTEEEKLKYWLKTQNPLFEDNDINYEFKQLYEVEKSKYTNENEEVDEQAYRIAQLKAKQRMQSDLARAEEYFVKFKDGLKLSPLTIAQPAVDPEVESIRQMLKDAPRLTAETKAAYAKLSPADLKAMVKLIDEANQIDVESSFEPDKEGFDNAVALASDLDAFLKQYISSEDGSPLRQKFAQDIYFARNREKIIQQAMLDAVNATIKRFINKPSGGSNNGQRNYGATSPSLPDELKKQLDMAYAKQNGQAV